MEKNSEYPQLQYEIFFRLRNFLLNNVAILFGRIATLIDRHRDNQHHIHHQSHVQFLSI